MTKEEFYALKKGDVLTTVERFPQRGLVVELTERWLVVRWEDKDAEAVEIRASLMVEYFCRNTNRVSEAEKDKSTPKPRTQEKETRRKKSAR